MNCPLRTGSPIVRLGCCAGLLAVICGCQRAGDVPAESKAAGGTVPAVAVTVVPVGRQLVERQIAAVGTLNGLEVVTVTPKVEGLVAAIYHDVGDRVPPNELLLELDATDYQLAVAEAERSLEQELAKLGLKEAPSDSFDIESLPSLVRARLLVENARRKFERVKSLAAQQAATNEELEQAETDVKVAEATLQQVQLDAASTLAAVKHRSAVLAQAEQRLAETRVRAPRFGAAGAGEEQVQYVVAQRMVAVGEMVRGFPASPAFELVLDHVLKLRMNVPERYLGEVRVEQEVRVRVDAYPRETFAARISRLNPTVDPQSRTFEVESLVPNPDFRLRHGGFAKAEIVTSTESEALVVPLESIVRFAGVTKVFRIRENRAQEVLVELGRQGTGWVEVRGELNANDLVATSGMSKLANETPVTVRHPLAETAQRPAAP